MKCISVKSNRFLQKIREFCILTCHRLTECLIFTQPCTQQSLCPMNPCSEEKWARSPRDAQRSRTRSWILVVKAAGTAGCDFYHALQYLEEKDLQKLKCQMQHSWEKRPLEKPLKQSYSTRFQSYRSLMWNQQRKCRRRQNGHWWN